MALAEQTEFAFMKAAKGTDVPKAEVIELHQDVARYKKMFPKLTSDEILTILRELMPAKAQMNAKGGVIKAQRGTDVVRAKDQIIDIKTEEDQIQALIDHSDGVLSREEALFFLRDIKKEYGLQDGGLLDQGGSKDPVSGNDVPIGSLKEEVRDDIPAMLSEGEFVFPADVTRYYGLDTLMKMRQKAKQGLKVMEAMGQMGNSEEATIPDDIPFDMDDLELAEGGVVKAQQGIYLPPDINTTTTTQQPGFGAAPTLLPVNQTGTALPVPDVVQPVLPQPKPPKSFEDLLGGANFDETRPYVNDAGDVRLIKFKNGEPIESIPEGFRPRGETDTVYQSPSLRGRASGSGQDSGSDTARPAITAEEKANEDKLLRESAQRDLPPRGAESFNYDVKESKDEFGRNILDEKGQPILDVVPTGKFKDYLRARSPAGTEGVDYAGTGKPFLLDDATGRLGKAGDFVDQGVVRAASVIPFASPLLRASDKDIRGQAAKRLVNGEYADKNEYNVLRNIIDLEPMKPGKFSLFKMEDDKDLKKSIADAKKRGYKQDVADKFTETKKTFAKNLQKERAKNPFSRTGTPNQDQATRLNEMDVQRKGGYANMSGSEIEEQQRKNEDNMRRAAAMDAQMERENKRRAESETGGTSGSAFSESTFGGGSSGGSGEQTHCCTASYKQKTMTISEVKELRRWHRQQSQIWQDGYDVWGKYVADGLVAKSKWQASVVKSVHQLIIKKKLTLKGLYGIMLISSGVYPIGLFKRVMRYGRIFQST